MPPTTTTVATTTTVDPMVADGKLIQAMWRHLSDANTADAETFAAATVNSAWPPGQWSDELALCYANKSIRNIDLVMDLASIEPDPTWMLPPNAPEPGTGQPVDGRVYIFKMEAAGSVAESHATVIDGKAYWFPGLPQSCVTA